MIINDVNSLMRWKTSDILYSLPNTFVSTGSNKIDTGVVYEAYKKYTLTCTFSVSQWSSAIQCIFGNTGGTNVPNYSTLRTQYYAGSQYTWGSGLGWSDGGNFASPNQICKILYTIDFSSGSSGSRYTKAYNTVSTLTKTSSGTSDYITGYSFELGQLGAGGTNNVGFNGSIYEFTIYNRILTSAEIDAYFT